MVNLKNKNVELSLHLMIWLALFILPAAFSAGTDTSWKELFRFFWLQLIFLAVVFYVNYLYLVKYVYDDKKFWFFTINLLLIFILIYFKNEIFDILEPHRRNPSDRKKPPASLFYFMNVLIYMIPVAFAIAINAGKKIKKAQEMKIEADHIKLQSELQHLKYQLQPHFFFNSLNNIYSLVDFDQEKAKHSIHSLSKLMRHLLYKTDVERISLSEEIEFLNKYIELMSLRLNDNTKVYTNFPETIPKMEIAPLLFISIVENAFKHGISATKPSDIHFKMEIEDKEIFFTASNSNFPKTDADKSGSGIGVENLKKRLQLLYPKKHEFHSHLNDGMYIAEIKILTD